MADEKLTLEFEGDDRELRKDLRKVKRNVDKALGDVERDAKAKSRGIARTMNAAVGGAVAGIAAAVTSGGIQAALSGIRAITTDLATSFREMGDEISGTLDTLGTLEAATGLSQDTLNGLRLAAGQTNKELAELVPKDLAKRILETSVGMGEGLRFFQQYGIEVKNTAGELRDADDVFLEIIDVLSEVESVTERAAVAEKLLGAEGRNMFSAFEDSSSITRFVEIAREFGTRVGPEATAAANAWWVATDTLRLGFEDLRRAIVDELGDDAVGVMQELSVSTVFLATLVDELTVDVAALLEGLVAGLRAVNPSLAVTAELFIESARAIAMQTDAVTAATMRAEEFRATFFGIGELVGPTTEDLVDMVGPIKDWTDGVEETTAAAKGATAAWEAAGSAYEAYVLTGIDLTGRFTDAHEEAAEIVTKTWEPVFDTLRDDLDEVRFSFDETMRGMGELAMQITDAVAGFSEIALSRQLESSRAIVQAAQASATMTEAQLAKIEDAERDAVKRAFERTKDFQRVQAIIEAARAAVSLIPAFAFLGPGAPIAAAGVAAAGLAVQLATIDAAQPPAFPSGGVYATGGATTGHGLAYIEDGEGVSNRRAMEDPGFRDAFERANRGERVGGGGAAVARVVVRYDSSARRLRVEPDEQVIGKQGIRRRS